MNIFLLSFVLSFSASADDTVAYKRKVKALSEQTKSKEEIKKELEKVARDSFYNPNHDYSRFIGRVTDRDDSASIFKVHSSNKNIKFFRSGDKLIFSPARLKDHFCTGYVRNREKDYFTVYVSDIGNCWNIDKYFRRGTKIKVISKTLAQRVKDASLNRIVLLKRRHDFIRQLNEINHFNWSYDQQRVKLAAIYDQKIIEIQKEKREALDALMNKKSESANLTQGLTYRLDKLDKDLDFYRVEPDISLGDRWNDDLDLGHPVGKRPTGIIEN